MDKYERVSELAQCFHCHEHHDHVEIEPASDPTELGLYYKCEDVDEKIDKIATLFQQLANELGIEEIDNANTTK